MCCAYCGDPATEWDHFRPIVKNQRPTGYVSEIANLVPACGKCNQSKGGKPWRDWINGPAKRSPRTRNVNDLDSRISRLETYEGWRPAERVDFEAIVGPEMWDRHWVNWKKVLETMKESQLLATEIRSKVADRKKR